MDETPGNFDITNSYNIYRRTLRIACVYIIQLVHIHPLNNTA